MTKELIVPLHKRQLESRLGGRVYSSNFKGFGLMLLLNCVEKPHILSTLQDIGEVINSG